MVLLNKNKIINIKYNIRTMLRKRSLNILDYHRIFYNERFIEEKIIQNKLKLKISNKKSDKTSFNFSIILISANQTNNLSFLSKYIDPYKKYVLCWFRE